MPYQEFEKIIRKTPQFVNRFAFISLPRNESSLVSLNVKLPKLPAIKWDYRVLSGRIDTEAHHWELDHQETTTKRVENLFRTAGLTIKKRMKHGYIRFYALEVS